MTGPTGREVCGYLLVRGSVHAHAYALALKKLTGVAIEQMLPTPDVNRDKIPECQKYLNEGSHRRLCSVSPDDCNEAAGICGNGEVALPGDPPGELELVEGHPEGGKIHDLKGDYGAFAPDCAPEEMFEIASKLYKKGRRPRRPHDRGHRPGKRVDARMAARILPGVLVCLLLTAFATALESVERRLAGQAYLEALVLAILLGVAVRAVWAPGPRWAPGIAFASKTLLEIAVVLLGASVSAATVLALGPGLLAGIALTVAVALASSYAIGRALGLPRRMAILVACGNSICGNSAIAAVAPVIGADGDEVASSIAFTAVLGVVVVLLLPLLVPVLSLSLTQYGVLAGLTVYAVPQVLAATLPIGALSNQVGTVVKLVRVLMLGPVVLGLSVIAPRLVDDRGARAKPKLHELVPWFIAGFLAVAAIRSAGLIPEPALPPLKAVAAVLTTVSMAALGLGVDLGVVARAGGRVTAAVVLSLLVLGAISLGLIRVLGVE